MVKEVQDEPRSYDITTSTGAEVQHNRSQIRERAMPAKPTPVASDQLQEATTTRSGRIIKTPQRLDLRQPSFYFNTALIIWSFVISLCIQTFAFSLFFCV